MLRDLLPIARQCKRARQICTIDRRTPEFSGKIPPSAAGCSTESIVSCLKKCASAKSILEGKLIHHKIIQNGLAGERFLINHVIHMYGKCGAVAEARAVFDNMAGRNSFSWNIMMGVYIQKGLLQEAREIFERMPNRTIVSWNAMIAAYAQHAQLEVALELFRLMPRRDAFSWNVLISGYVQQGELKEALHIYKQMPQHDVVSATTIIGALAQEGDLKEAAKIFEKMNQRDVVTWTAMVVGYAKHGHLTEALQLFHQMPFRDIVAWNAMISGYAQQGHLEKALQLFWQMPSQDVVSWNAIISGYSQQGQLNEALQFFEQMRWKGFNPDKVTFVSLVDACAKRTALAEGKEMHFHIIESGLGSDDVLLNALVSMYAKCGNLSDARIIFDKISQKDVVSWTAMITAYAQHGRGCDVLNLIQEMQLNGALFDEVTFCSIFHAYSHAGLVDEAWHCLVCMSKEHGLAPAVEHFNCMIDAFCRTEWLDEAEALLLNVPVEPNQTSWTAMLGSCRFDMDVERGKRAALQVSQLDPDNAAAFVLLSDILARGEH